jgi:hypothetical protein
MAGLNDKWHDDWVSDRDKALIDQPVRIFSIYDLLDPPDDYRVDWGEGVDPDTPSFHNDLWTGHRDVKGVRVIYEPENRIWILTGEREAGCCGAGGYKGQWPD